MFVLTDQPSIANHFIAQLRDVAIQKDSMRFRKNMERIGELLAYEISKTLPYTPASVASPLGTAHTQLLTQQPVLATILRAGLPLFQGAMNIFDAAECSFIGAYRGPHQADETFEVEMHYVTSPSLQDKTLILTDPMLATGKSLVRAYTALLQYGTPAFTHVVAAIASRDGVKFVQQYIPNCKLWVGTIDETLNQKFYIVPGLGDAGDLSFGEKR
jgi:uracil phosphoribosyltransferase